MDNFKKLHLIAFLIFTSFLTAQVTGVVKDENGEALADVNIYFESSTQGTTSNSKGKFEIQQKTESQQAVLVFQYLGFKTQKVNLDFTAEIKPLEIVLLEEEYSLEDVVITENDEDPALAVIRRAIKNRKENRAKIEAFEADFYSKALWEAKDVPEKIMGQEVGDFDGALDSTRSGVIYLSETVSKIKFKAPSDFYEYIEASKVSGDDNGFSWNNAEDFNNSFYNNTVYFNVEMISPIANYAFNYYDYRLDGVFYSDFGHLVNRIEVISKRKNDRTFDGFVYIVEDTGELFGVELSTNGKRTQIPPLEKITFVQNFNFDETRELFYVKTQSFNFKWMIFGFGGEGKFIGYYNNYNFNPDFKAKTFTNEIIAFAENANKKDSLFWEQNRPIPLVNLEVEDYQKKDSIQELRQSKTYLDSIDAEDNKFRVFDVITGYSWKNSYKKRSAGYGGLIGGINFNTVQGWNVKTDFYYRQKDEQNSFREFWDLNANINYGFSDEQLRGSLNFRKRFNYFSKSYLSFSAGLEAKQINNTNPISERIATVAATFAERNFLKLYDQLYARAYYSQEILNGLNASISLAAEKRTPLLNSTTSTVWVSKSPGFSSNDPFFPEDETSLSFEEHQMFVSQLNLRYNFGQKYISRPDGKYTINNNKFPTLYLTYRKGFGSDVSEYDFDRLSFSVNQNVNLKNVGNLAYSVNTGTFFGNDAMALVDFKHFAGNETYVGTTSNYINRFNLLGYYDYSTTEDYMHAHIEHNFKGWILNKIPLINKLNYNLIVGAKTLQVNNRDSYNELSIGIDNLGFGKFRFLRLDYVKPYQNGWQSGGVIFGLKFLNLL